MKAIGESDIHRDGCMGKHTDGHIDKHTDGHMDKHTDGHMNKHTDVFSDGHTERHTPLEKCQKLLADNRREAGRPDSLDHMSLEQLREEKLSVQKTLIQYESKHGRPVSLYTWSVYRMLVIIFYSKQKKVRK